MNLAPMYPHPGDSLRAWQVYGGLLILLAITMLYCERAFGGAICSWDGCGFWEHGSDDRSGASGSPGDGRPLRLSAVARDLHHDLLGRGRLGGGEAFSARWSCRSPALSIMLR